MECPPALCMDAVLHTEFTCFVSVSFNIEPFNVEYPLCIFNERYSLCFQSQAVPRMIIVVGVVIAVVVVAVYSDCVPSVTVCVYFFFSFFLRQDFQCDFPFLFNLKRGAAVRRQRAFSHLLFLNLMLCIFLTLSH